MKRAIVFLAAAIIIFPAIASAQTGYMPVFERIGTTGIIPDIEKGLLAVLGIDPASEMGTSIIQGIFPDVAVTFGTILMCNEIDRNIQFLPDPGSGERGQKLYYRVSTLKESNDILAHKDAGIRLQQVLTVPKALETTGITWATSGAEIYFTNILRQLYTAKIEPEKVAQVFAFLFSNILSRTITSLTAISDGPSTSKEILRLNMLYMRTGLLNAMLSNFAKDTDMKQAVLPIIRAGMKNVSSGGRAQFDVLANLIERYYALLADIIHGMGEELMYNGRIPLTSAILGHLQSIYEILNIPAENWQFTLSTLLGQNGIPKDMGSSGF